ncbi:MAG TPA: DUF6325 family protein [Acidimicrobiia bacterium]
MSESATADSMGPVELSVLAFPETTFDGTISEALRDIVERGIVSILDLLIVAKDDEGVVSVIELADADAVIAAQFEKVDGEVMWLLSDQDIAAAGEFLEPGTTAVLVVWESTWARQLKGAISRAGGRLVVHDRLDANAVAASIAASPGGG